MRRTPKDFRKRMTRAALDMANLIRRVIFSATAGGRWSIEGYELDDLDSSDTVTEGADDDPIEVFGGIHIYARPAADDKAEGILLHVGSEAEHPVLAAVRNEDARLRYVSEFEDLSEGEVVVFNSAGTARVLIRASGEIEITVASGEDILLKTKAGIAAALATKADIDAIETFQKKHFDTVLGHTHVGIVGAPIIGTGTTGAGFSVPSATGTLRVKAE